ncbi:MAG: CYTH domain-containing protein [Bacteroidetes bacterium]|nr:CYTH domain-containing protein [Bacteroidota bacterium]
MPLEIERKFLVKNKDYRIGARAKAIRQGFLNLDKNRLVRVRLSGDKAYITVKGPDKGIQRLEFEYSIPPEEAVIMLDELCQKPLIEKTRYYVSFEGFTWEIDEFVGDNEGLIVAEIELEYEGQDFPQPGWLGLEVSGENRYYNASLVNYPYKSWKNSEKYQYIPE